MIHGLGPSPCEETGNGIGPQKDLDLVLQVTFDHVVSAVPVRDQVELGVSIAGRVRELGTWIDEEVQILILPM